MSDQPSFILRLPKAHYNSSEEYLTDLGNGYDQSAVNCYTAAVLYLVTFFVSAAVHYVSHVRTREVPAEPLENFASINS